MAVVLKRDGTREPFNMSKLIRSLNKAGVDDESAFEIAEGLEYDLADEEISSDDIRELIEDELNYYHPEALKKFNKKHYH